MLQRITVYLRKGNEYRRLECDFNTTVERMRSLCQTPNSTLLVPTGEDEGYYVWFDGPLCQWKNMRHNNAINSGGIHMYEVDDFDRTCVDARIDYRQAGKTQPLGSYRIPANKQDEDTFVALYIQVRNRSDLRHLPDISLVTFEYDPQERVITAVAEYRSANAHPILPRGVSVFAHILLIPPHRMKCFGTVCPRCNAGYVQHGACLGGVVEYEMNDGTRRKRLFPCDHAPGVELESTTGFKDRSRLHQLVPKGRYHPHNHFMEALASYGGTTDTTIDPTICRDVFYWMRQRDIDPCNRDQVKEALSRLETYYRHRYEAWYQDTQKIATIVNGDNDPGPVVVIPNEHKQVMRRIFIVAEILWLQCPPEIRGPTRKNFLHARFNIWACATVAAHTEQDPVYLTYRLIVAEPDGSIPRLQDAVRQNEYIRVWRWICDTQDWPYIDDT